MFRLKRTFSEIAIKITQITGYTSLKGQYHHDQSRLSTRNGIVVFLFKMNTVTENYWLIYAVATVI